jgi:hypothetical protein
VRSGRSPWLGLWEGTRRFWRNRRREVSCYFAPTCVILYKPEIILHIYK